MALSDNTPLRVVASIAGAAIAGCITGLMMAVAGSKMFAIGQDDWGAALGVFVLAIATGIIGACLGGFAAWQLTGPPRPGLSRAVSLGFVAFCGVGALWIAYESWADSKKRSAFQAERIDDSWKSFGFAGIRADFGERLAETVRSCIARNGPPSSEDAVVAGDCSSLKHHRIDAPAPRRPPLPHEDGWRWKYVDDVSGWRVVVAPHPDLSLPGPIFEIDRNLRIMRRDNADSPAHAVWAGLVVATRYRECLLSAQGQSQALGTWKGDWQMLPSTVAETTGCSSVTAVDVARVRPGRWLLKLKAVDAEAIPDPVDVTYDIAAYGFTLRTHYGGAHYLLDVGGGWHKTREPRGANLDDPAPPACEIDLAVPCTE